MVNEQTGEGTVIETTEALGMTTEEVVEEEPRRRGRPAGATTTSRATGVDELKEEIRNIKNKYIIENPNNLIASFFGTFEIFNKYNL